MDNATLRGIIEPMINKSKTTRIVLTLSLIGISACVCVLSASIRHSYLVTQQEHAYRKRVDKALPVRIENYQVITGLTKPPSTTTALPPSEPAQPLLPAKGNHFYLVKVIFINKTLGLHVPNIRIIGTNGKEYYPIAANEIKNQGSHHFGVEPYKSWSGNLVIEMPTNAQPAKAEYWAVRFCD